MAAKSFGVNAPTWRICIVVTILACLATCAATAEAAITRVDVDNRADRVVIDVQSTAPLHMHAFASSVGKYLGFEFACAMDFKARTVAIRSGWISNVRCTNFSMNPPTSRIVLNTSAKLVYETEFFTDKSHMTITVHKKGCKSPVVSDQLGNIANRQPSTVNSWKSVRNHPLTVNPAVEAAGPAKFIPAPKLVSPASVKAASSVPAIHTSKMTAHAIAAPIPAEPVAEAVISSQPSGMVREVPSVDQAPVQVAVAPALYHVSKGSQPQEGASVVALAPEDPSTSTVEATTARLSKNSGPAVSLNFLAADIHDVLKALSTQSGRNIVTGKDVTGNITVSLSNVGMEEALSYVAKLSGYKYIKDHDTYLVGSAASLNSISDKTTPVSTVEVVNLNYANGDDIIALLKMHYPDVVAGMSSFQSIRASGGGKPAASKVLILSGPLNQLADAKAFAEQVEASMKGQSDEIITQIYHAKYVKSSELARNLLSLIPGISVCSGPTGAFRPFVTTKTEMSVPIGDRKTLEKDKNDEGFLLDDKKDSGGDAGAKPAGPAGASSELQSTVEPLTKETDSQVLVLAGRKEDIAKALDLAAELDVKPTQFKIEAKITSLNKSGEDKLGVSWSWGSLTVQEGYTSSSKEGNAPTNTLNVNKATGVLARQPWNYSATLDALITKGDAKLLASPNLVCIEGQPGLFFVGDEVHYIVLVQQTAQGNNVSTDKAMVGVELRVVGKVSSDGYITLNLHPEVSVLQLTNDATAGITLPTITRRYTDQVVRVKSGDTIVIGGLMNDQDIETMTKVPILGDLPVLGQLFRHKDKTTNHSEVVIFLTASVCKD